MIRRYASFGPVNATMGIAVGTMIAGGKRCFSITSNLMLNRAATRTDAHLKGEDVRERRSDQRLLRY